MPVVARRREHNCSMAVSHVWSFFIIRHIQSAWLQMNSMSNIWFQRPEFMSRSQAKPAGWAPWSKPILSDSCHWTESQLAIFWTWPSFWHDCLVYSSRRQVSEMVTLQQSHDRNVYPSGEVYTALAIKEDCACRSTYPKWYLSDCRFGTLRCPFFVQKKILRPLFRCQWVNIYMKTPWLYISYTKYTLLSIIYASLGCQMSASADSEFLNYLENDIFFYHLP